MNHLAIALSTSLLVSPGCDFAKDALAEGETRRSPSSEDGADTEGRPSKDPGRAKRSAGFTYAYPDTKVPTHDAVRTHFRDARLLEEITKELNETVRIPRDVTIRLQTCGAINAWYDEEEAAIVFCYDLLEHAAQLFRQQTDNAEDREEALIGTFLFILAHELGHALVHELKLPVTGREEDAVDQLATLMLLVDDGGAEAAVAAGAYFALSARGAPLAFWDEHSLGQQRFFDAACLAYGSNPVRGRELVTEGLLPESRAARCPKEFDAVSRAWKTLLQPHLIDEARFWTARERSEK